MKATSLTNVYSGHLVAEIATDIIVAGEFKQPAIDTTVFTAKTPAGPDTATSTRFVQTDDCAAGKNVQYTLVTIEGTHYLRKCVTPCAVG